MYEFILLHPLMLEESLKKVSNYFPRVRVQFPVKQRLIPDEPQKCCVRGESSLKWELHAHSREIIRNFF